MKKEKRPKTTVTMKWSYYNDDPATKAMYKAYRAFVACIDKLEPVIGAVVFDQHGKHTGGKP